MLQASLDALKAYIRERMGEYPSNYQLQNVGQSVLDSLDNEQATDTAPVPSSNQTTPKSQQQTYDSANNNPGLTPQNESYGNTDLTANQNETTIQPSVRSINRYKDTSARNTNTNDRNTDTVN